VVSRSRPDLTSVGGRLQNTRIVREQRPDGLELRLLLQQRAVARARGGSPILQLLEAEAKSGQCLVDGVRLELGVVPSELRGIGVRQTYRAVRATPRYRHVEDVGV